VGGRRGYRPDGHHDFLKLVDFVRLQFPSLTTEGACVLLPSSKICEILESRRESHISKLMDGSLDPAICKLTFSVSLLDDDQGTTWEHSEMEVFREGYPGQGSVATTDRSVGGLFGVHPSYLGHTLAHPDDVARFPRGWSMSSTLQVPSVSRTRRSVSPTGKAGRESRHRSRQLQNSGRLTLQSAMKR
jgi:hypothetical protein